MAKTRYNIIEITQKKTGVTYIYEDYSYWDKQKGYSTHKRKSIGKIGENGEKIYNKYYLEKLAAIKAGTYVDPEDVKAATISADKEPQKEAVSPSETPEVSSTILTGQKMVLDKVCQEVALRSVLQKAFSKADADSILALAYYVVCQGKAFSRSEDWLINRGYSKLGLTSQRISDLLASISDDRVNVFFKEWIARQLKGDSMLFDITSVSTYGRSNIYAERGYNRDHENLEQINLSLLTSVGSSLPIWYCMTPGSMSDVAVLEFVLKTLDKLGIEKFTFFGDRGFYSERNLKLITKYKHRFTVPVPSSVAWQKEMIADAKPTMIAPENVIELEDGSLVYGKTVYKKTDYGRTWYHIYYDSARKGKIIDDFMLRLRKCKDELETGVYYEKNKDFYEKYLIVHETPKRGRKVIYNDQAVQDFIDSDSCYWVLVSTAEKDTEKALLAYRNRNDVEVNFDDVKNSMDLRRLRNHSEKTVKGKLFVIFIALILLTQLRKDVQKTPMRDRHYWSERDFLEKVASYTRIHFESKYKDVYSVPTAAQRFVFDYMGIPYYYKGNVRNAKQHEPGGNSDVGNTKAQKNAHDAEETTN